MARRGGLPYPKQPDEKFLELIAHLTIDTVNGRVYRGNRELGHRDAYGRVSVSVPGIKRSIKRAHLVWWKATGKWPTLVVDHKDEDCTNDRFDNLQELTHRDNVRKALIGRRRPESRQVEDTFQRILRDLDRK